MAITLPDVQQLGEFQPNAVQPRPIEGESQAASYQPGVVGAAQSQAADETKSALDKLQDLHNDTQARNSVNQFTDAATTLDAQFRQIHGEASINAIPQFQAQYKALQQQYAQGLTPDAQQKYLNESSNYMSFVHRQMAEFGAQEYTKSQLTATDTAISQAERAVTNNPDDPAVYEFNKNRVADAAAARVRIQGGGNQNDQDEAAKNAVDDFDEYRGKAYLQNKPAPQQMQLLSQSLNEAPPKDMGADYVKPYTPSQIQNIRSLVANPSPYDDLFQQYGKQYGIDPQELKLHAAAESSMNPNADNGQSKGLMQISNDNIKKFGVTNPLDPAQSIEAAAKIMAANGAKNTRDADLMYYGGKNSQGPNSKQYAENLAAVRGDGAQATGTPVDDIPVTERMTMFKKLQQDQIIQQKMAKNDDNNSPNGYDTVIRALQPWDDDHPNHIKNQNQLDSLLAKTDGTGINSKDYNDAKPITNLPKDSPIKEALLLHMEQIKNANGNIDGNGQQRAMQWYNQQMAAWQDNQTKGDKAMDAVTFASHIGEAAGPLYAPPTPSRMTQISNWVKESTGLGQIKVKNADGVVGYMPAGNVEKAMKAGYEKVE